MQLLSLDKVIEGLAHLKKNRVVCRQHICGIQYHDASKLLPMVELSWIHNLRGPNTEPCCASQII